MGEREGETLRSRSPSPPLPLNLSSLHPLTPRPTLPLLRPTSVACPPPSLPLRHAHPHAPGAPLPLPPSETLTLAPPLPHPPPPLRITPNTLRPPILPAQPGSQPSLTSDRMLTHTPPLLPTRIKAQPPLAFPALRLPSSSSRPRHPLFPPLQTLQTTTMIWGQRAVSQIGERSHSKRNARLERECASDTVSKS